MKILDFGSLNLDNVFQVDHFGRPGETVKASSVSLFPGGKGLNQAVAASLAGSPVQMAGAIGPDGTWLLPVLQEKGVDTGHIRVKEEILTGRAIIETDPSGDNRILLDPGANETIGPTLIRQVLAGCEAGDLLLCQNEISQTATLLQEARARGMRILFNPAPMTPDIRELDLSGLACLAVNESEGSLLLGQEETSPEELCRRFLTRWPDSALLLTLGSRGALYAREGYGCFMPAFQVPVTDTTGAGDTFLGYFADGLARNLPVPEIMRRAAAASALSIQQPGAASSIPDQDQVARFLADHPVMPEEFDLQVNEN